VHDGFSITELPARRPAMSARRWSLNREARKALQAVSRDAAGSC